MNRLEELILELCPNGVEYCKLKDCTEMKRGTSATKNTLVKGNIPVISGGKKPAFYCDNHNRDGETITVAGSGAGAGYVQYWNEPIFVNDAFSIKVNEKLLTRYVYHYLLNIQDDIYATKKGSGVPHVHISSIENFKISVPPLPVQLEIVKLLDTFTEFTEELMEKLKVELQSRKTQYAEYRHRLFSDSESVSKTTLGEIVDVCMCKRIKKEQTSSVGDIPFYQNGTLGGVAKLFITKELFEEFSKKYKYPLPGEVMLSTVGTIGKTIQFDGNPAYFQDSNIVWLRRKSNEVTNEFLYWYCLSMPWKLPERATLKHLHNYMITSTEISIPSLERQAYIIQKFQELTHSFEQIFVAIEKEIDARRKQYEYYRDKLLTFKEAK